MAAKLTKKQQTQLTEKLAGIIQKNNALQLRLSAGSSVNDLNVNQISNELNRIHHRAIGKEFPAVFSFEPRQIGSGDPSPDNIRPIVGYEIDGIDTVYGGSLNIETGVLLVTYGILEVSNKTSSVKNWNKSDKALNGYYWDMYSKFQSNQPMFCNMFKVTDNISEYCSLYGYCYHDNSASFNCDPALCGNTVQTWYEYITALKSNGTPLVVASMLSTPVEHTLTLKQMLQLLDQL